MHLSLDLYHLPLLPYNAFSSSHPIRTSPFDLAQLEAFEREILALAILGKVNEDATADAEELREGGDGGEDGVAADDGDGRKKIRRRRKKKNFFCHYPQ